MTNTVAACKALVKQHGITEAQFDVLRRAARKYEEYVPGKGALHTGEVNTYGVRQDTLDALKGHGLIEYTYRVNNPQVRMVEEEKAVVIITEAHKRFAEVWLRNGNRRSGQRRSES